MGFEEERKRRLQTRAEGDKEKPQASVPVTPWTGDSDWTLSLVPRAPVDWSAHVVCADRLRGVHYVPDFVSDAEAQELLERLDTMPESTWVKLRRRRLQNHGGTPHSDGMIPERVPSFIQAVMDATVQAGVFEEPPNHVLLNEYQRGQGIMPHQDGPLYQPVVAILSLAGPAMLQFWSSLEATKRNDATASVLCHPNSLLVFREDAYQTHWHGIEETDADVVAEHTGNEVTVGVSVPRGARRVSLTIRRVCRVLHEEPLLTDEARQEARRKQQWWVSTRGEQS